MRSVPALKAIYAVGLAVFTWLLVTMILTAMSGEGDPMRLVQTSTGVGFLAFFMAWLGWVLGRRLGLSRSDSTAVALGSVIGGIHVVVFLWVMLRRPPASGPVT
jgi:hypothetical protein